MRCNSYSQEFSRTDAEKSLIEGIDLGLQQLKQLDSQKFVDSLAPHAKSAHARTTLDLVKANLLVLQD